MGSGGRSHHQSMTRTTTIPVSGRTFTLRHLEGRLVMASFWPKAPRILARLVRAALLEQTALSRRATITSSHHVWASLGTCSELAGSLCAVAWANSFPVIL